MTRKVLSVVDMVHELLPVARAAGKLIMTYYQNNTPAERKADNSPVTQADREADVLISRHLKEIAPHILIVSEEGEWPDVAGAEYFWLVDPLDGTRSFVRGSGFFTVNIGLVGPDRLPVAGIIYEPVEQMLYWGVEGKAFCQCGDAVSPTPIAMREAPEEPVAVISHSHPGERMQAYLREHNIRQSLPFASSIKFCRMAEGLADLYPRFGPTMEWDTAAGDAIVRAAGGEMVNHDGSPFLYGKPGFENGGFVVRKKA